MTQTLCRTLTSLGLLLLFGCAPDPAPVEQVLVIRGGTVFDSRAGTWLDNTTIVATEGRITFVGEQPTKLPDHSDGHADVIDAAGRWVVPGFIDAHVHDADPTYLGDMLRWGVTAIFLMPRWPGPSPGATEQASEDAAAQTPRLRTSQMFTGDFPDNVIPGVYRFLKPKTVADARRAVTMMADSGYGQIKIIQDDSMLMSGPGHQSPLLSNAVFGALVDTANSREMRVYVHAMGVEVAEVAFAAEVDVLIHGIVDRPMPAAIWQRFAAHGGALAPTVHQLYLFGDQRAYARRLLSDARLTARLTDAQRAGVQAQADSAAPIVGPNVATLVENTPAYVATSALNTRAALDAGVAIALGTDGGPAGASTHLEMELLHDAGLTPVEALTAATWGGAVALGRSDELGALEPGKIADLVILAADPTVDVRNTREIVEVLKGGVRVALESRAP